MLYELIGVVRPGRLNEVKEIAKRSGSIILNAGGVVRGYTNWGTFLLPKPLRKKDQGVFNRGHYFIMRFDSSAYAQHSMKRTLSNDPRLIRYSVVKLGNKLDEIADVPGTAPWGTITQSVETQRSSRGFDGLSDAVSAAGPSTVT